VAYLAGRFPLRERHRRDFAVHAAAALLFSPLLMAVTFILNNLTHGQPLSWVRLLRDTIIPELAWGITAYVVLLSVARATELRRRDQARTLGEAQLSAALARARLDALRMQLEPHFLFNALNSAASLLRRDPDGAERMLARLGDFLRLTLDDGMPQKVALRRELELLERYLDIERVRFRDRLSVSIDVPPALLAASVPCLVLQPLVENAIRHGLAARAGPGRVAVRASRQGSGLRLEVEDDGPGLPVEGHLPRTGVGLSNMQERLGHLYGGRAGLRIEGHAGKGLHVTIDLPWEPDHPGEPGAARAS
jgi:two-component system LytT family sensor kinase